ncbi:MAG: PLP-dependent transferase [Flavobacterium sp.]|uniref:PLP-dependent transferase n=1 Tax=Flavobacterium sp. TaxID=239 RepID=UPI0022C15B59|nr:PLP-dependent transferase [Flavobacterium sp.]MCZ8198403.1 PLP-dependent transferase [Flavobacterium sp.]
MLTNSGMNELFTAYETILSARKSEGRTIAIQLGWLYVDTIEIIEKRANSHLQINIHNKLQLENWLESNHKIITEITTNPLIQCIDLPWLSILCKKFEIVLIVDVTIATTFNVEVLPYCDIAVESLTKFASGNADLLMGTFVLNEKSKIVQANKKEFHKFIIPAFEGELQRPACQIQNYESRVKKVSENTKTIYDYLNKQSFVKEIYSVLHHDSVGNFKKIRKSEDSFPGVLSVVFDEDLEFYYDKLQLTKGPSLGTNSQLQCLMCILHIMNSLKPKQEK